MGLSYHIKTPITKGTRIGSIGLIFLVFLLKSLVDALGQFFTILAFLVMVEKNIDILTFTSAIDMGNDQSLIFSSILFVQFVYDFGSLS